MRIEELAPGVLMFVGDEVESVATAFIHGDEVVLVDALGSVEDAQWLRATLCGELGKTVRIIAATHYMSDHLAALHLFPDALVLAHRHHRATFLSQNRRIDAFYRDPDLAFDDLLLRWGPHELRFAHNPGKTMDHLSVDVPSADLVCMGDAIVGNIVYLSKADPALMRSAIERARRWGRRKVIGGHMGAFDAVVLDHAAHYLTRIQQHVVAIRLRAEESQAEREIAAIPIEACLAPGVQACTFEREWHQRNLHAVAAQSIFAFDAARSAQDAAR